MKKIAQVIKNHLDGKESDQSRFILSKISSKLSDMGYVKPYSITKISQDNSFERERFNKAEHMDRIRSLPDEAIEYALKDLNETIEIQEKARREGGFVPKLGYYYDERGAYLEEKRNREQLGIWKKNLLNSGDYESINAPDLE